MKAEKSSDEINSWESLIEYCSSLDLIFTNNASGIQLCKLSDSFPPKVVFSILIDHSYHVSAYRGSTSVNLFAFFSTWFERKLTLFSQIKTIIDIVENTTVDICEEINAHSNDILALCEKTLTTEETSRKIKFIVTQLMIQALPGQHQGIKYDAYLISEAVNLYLRSRNAYRALKIILVLPHEKTLRRFFGKFASAGDAGECNKAIHDVLSTLEKDHTKFVFISADEIYVKPAIRYIGGHVIGFAQN